MDSNPDGASYYRDVFQSIEEQMGYQPRNGYINTFNNSTYYGNHFGDKSSGVSVKYAFTPYYGESIATVAHAIDK